MAAPNMTVTSLGQQNLTGSTTATFLKVFSGEVLTAFQETTKFLSRHSVRSITSGKSAQFPTQLIGSLAQ